ncbi:unnamed protein product [Rhodiola kirilowii]
MHPQYSARNRRSSSHSHISIVVTSKCGWRRVGIVLFDLQKVWLEKSWARKE